jgi:hypothetical protein
MPDYASAVFGTLRSLNCTALIDRWPLRLDALCVCVCVLGDGTGVLRKRAVTLKIYGELDARNPESVPRPSQSRRALLVQVPAYPSPKPAPVEVVVCRLRPLRRSLSSRKSRRRCLLRISRKRCRRAR